MQPSINGASDHPNRKGTFSKRSACGRENRRASSTCAVPRTFTAYRSAVSNADRLLDRLESVHAINGGASDTDVNELAVKPT